MVTSTDVKLPKGLKPIFPDLCIVCVEKPDSTSKIVQHSQNPIALFFAPFLYFFGWSRVEFPICMKCKSKFFMQRWGRTIICWTIVALAVVVLGPYFANWSPGIRKLALAGACLLILVPYITFEVFFPRAFDTTAYPMTTTYEFRSSLLGWEFYTANKEAYPHSKITIGD